MKFDGLAFYQYRFEGLDTKPVKSRSTVQHYRMFSDNAFQNVPNLRTNLFYHSLCLLDVM